MLQNILLQVSENLKKTSDLNEKQIEILIKKMRLWKKNTIVYPSNIKSALYIDYKKTYYILNKIKDMGILDYSYELYCSKCEKFLDKSFDTLNELPKEIYCDEQHKLNPFSDVIVVYKVIYDEK